MGKVLERFWGILAASERWFIGGHENPGSSHRVIARVLPLAAGPPAGRRRALYDGGHWLVGVFPVLPAEPVVPGASASSGGGTGALELPNAVRPRQDPQRQSYPGAAGPGQPRPLSSGLHRGGGRTGGFWRPGGFPPSHQATAIHRLYRDSVSVAFRTAGDA